MDLKAHGNDAIAVVEGSPFELDRGAIFYTGACVAIVLILFRHRQAGTTARDDSS